ncbi:ABC transporter substrate-binding protein [Acidisphaera sp. L21]|uniref:ABC transporter substrate-binding protein n=1 Tax=Acidisphaera sp. L21 TaxID=1641851 RepID=UPI00131DC861|nr:ABC transporter substrate-binding protein [Acidisphaera sp. L21]
MIARRSLLAGSAAAAVIAPRVRAQGAKPRIKLGVLNDMSGPYRDTGGPLSITCVQQAVQDFGDHGFAVDVINADHGNKPDQGASIARRWYDEDGVDVILDVPTSSVALAVSTVTKEKNKVNLNSGAGTVDLTGSQCNPNTIQWTYDVYMLAKSTGGAMVKSGGDSWFFVTADYVFGQQLASEGAKFVKAAGGKVLGETRYPFPATNDFSSFLLQAQTSGAKVLGLANAGADTINCIKQAAEFGLTQRMKLAALLMFISDVNGLGLQTAQGLTLTESFYWDLNDRTRAFSARLKQKAPDVRADMDQAGCYSAALHYLKAVADMGVANAKANGAAVVARMKAMPTDDDAFGKGSVREDGRGMFPAYLFEVKSPAESQAPWDYYKLIATTPAGEAYRPLAEGGCPLVHT